MRIDTVKTHDITRYQLVDGGRHLLTFDSLAEFARDVLAGDEQPSTEGGKR